MTWLPKFPAIGGCDGYRLIRQTALDQAPPFHVVEEERALAIGVI